VRKIFEQGIISKNINDTAKYFEKKLVHVENGPPPHHFSNGPPLISVGHFDPHSSTAF
jgi:hypothetical protein